MVIEMEKSITVVGGDLRTVKLIEMLDNDGYKVYTYGLENSEEVLNMERVELCPTLEEAVSASKVVVGPIPLSSDRRRLSTPFGRNNVELPDFVEALKGKYLIAGNIGIKEELEEKIPENKEIDKDINKTKENKQKELGTN